MSNPDSQSQEKQIAISKEQFNKLKNQLLKTGSLELMRGVYNLYPGLEFKFGGDFSELESLSPYIELIGRTSFTDLGERQSTDAQRGLVEALRRIRIILMVKADVFEKSGLRVSVKEEVIEQEKTAQSPFAPSYIVRITEETFIDSRDRQVVRAFIKTKIEECGFIPDGRRSEFETLYRRTYNPPDAGNVSRKP